MALTSVNEYITPSYSLPPPQPEDKTPGAGLPTDAFVCIDLNLLECPYLVVALERSDQKSVVSDTSIALKRRIKT